MSVSVVRRLVTRAAIMIGDYRNNAGCSTNKPCLNGSNAGLFASRIQELQKNFLNCYGDPRTPAAYRFFQRFSDFRFGKFPRSELHVQVLPHLRKRLAGVKQRLDRHSARTSPSDDLTDGFRAAIPSGQQAFDGYFPKQRVGWSPLPPRWAFSGNFSRQQFQHVHGADAQSAGRRARD